MKTLLRPLLNLLPAEVTERLHAAKHRRHWLRQDAQCHADYLAHYQTRSEVIGLAREWVLARSPSLLQLRVLEFGCSAANNLKLLRELIPQPVDYVGFDLQPQAIEMGRRHFPDATLFVGDDAAMLARLPALGRFDIFLASGVLAYLPQERCQAVLTAATRHCDAVLVCDDLARFDHAQGHNDGLFLHPYAHICQLAGLRVVLGPTPAREGNRYNSFLATPQ